MLIAGQKPTQTFLRRYSGYVEQFDTLIPVLTVYEMLLYTAELKTSRAVPLKVWCCSTCRLMQVTSDALCSALARLTLEGHILTSLVTPCLSTCSHTALECMWLLSLVTQGVGPPKCTCSGEVVWLSVRVMLCRRRRARWMQWYSSLHCRLAKTPSLAVRLTEGFQEERQASNQLGVPAFHCAAGMQCN